MINFAIYTAILLTLPVGIVGLIILQILSDRSSASKRSDPYTTILLYAIYISGFCCGVIGFSLHFSTSVVWCEKYGLLPCFTLLGASKAVLYSFFLRRAKLAQGITVHKGIKMLFNYIAPSYLFVYWILYCVLTTVIFTGRFASHNAVSNCIFGHWAIWFCIFAGCVDMFNCASSLALFSYPLLHAMRKSKTLAGSSQIEQRNHAIRVEFIAVMKWNVVLTAIASISSVTTLFMIAVTNHYIWLFCLGDPFINALCTFCMIATNRRYLANLCSVQLCVCGANKDAETTADATMPVTTRMRNFTLNDWVHHHVQLSQLPQKKEEDAQDSKPVAPASSPALSVVVRTKSVTSVSSDEEEGSLPNLDLAVTNSNPNPPALPGLIIVKSNSVEHT